MTLHTLVRLAKLYDELGWSVKEQLESALDGDMYELNPAAARLIIGWLKDAEDQRVEGADTLRIELEEHYAGAL